MFLAHILPWNITSPIWKKSFIERKLKRFDETYSRLQDVELHTRALIQVGVNFKIVGGVPDFFYRIDEKRKLLDPYQFLENFIISIGTYIKTISKVLTELQYCSKYHRALNGTLQSAYITIQIHYNLKQITLQERNELFKKVNQLNSQNLVFKIYTLGLKNNIHKIKGYNWAFKQLLIKFK